MSTRKRDDEVPTFGSDTQASLVNLHFWSSCVNCRKWDAAKEVCTVVGQRPPTIVIVVGCASWKPDETPF